MNFPSVLRRNASFRLLFGAQAISLLGSGVSTVGLVLFAYGLTDGHGVTAVVGNALMLRILAFMLFSQPAGVLADRVDRKKLLIGADVARCLLLLVFPCATTVWQIYGLVFVLNAITAFFTPTFEASIPDVVGSGNYVGALALSRLAVDLEAIAAPALAGPLAALLGARWLFWFDALTFLISAALVYKAELPRSKRALTTTLSAGAFCAELAHGARVLMREPSLRQALVLSVSEAAAGACAIVATVSYVRDVLQRSMSAYTLCLAIVGLGSSLVALGLARLTTAYERGANVGIVLHTRRHAWTARALLAGGVVLSASLLPAIYSPPLGIFATLWFLNGAGQALIAVPSSTLLVEHTLEQERGRAFAAHFALTHACWLITYPLAGHVAARWGAPALFASAGVVCLLVTLLAVAMGGGTKTAHSHAMNRTDNSTLETNHVPT